MTRSTFSANGLNIGNNDSNMTYLYGLSDFFSVLFEDTTKVNLLLECQSQIASQVYSNFLQLTSTISLENIQNTLNQSITLVTLNSSNLVPGETNLYNLPVDILDTRYIANRAFLPTTLFENKVHYNFETSSTGAAQIRFSTDITSAGFSARIASDNLTTDYALWFVDSNLDEGWMNTYYANLIGVSPETSTDSFKNFVYGLYYVYTNGPTLSLIKKGLNLCLGIPLARGVETVLEISTYLQTGQQLVLTTENQYLIPFGLPPSVVIGQTLAAGDELAEWVEVKDYINDGDWWINLSIPEKLIKEIPPGQTGRFAVDGSHYDYVMRTYLKKHTFLVSVNVTYFENIQLFQQLSEIISRVKPAYTEAIYIWTIPNMIDEMSFDDNYATQIVTQSRCDNGTLAIEKMFRGNTSQTLLRGCPVFLRCNVPMYVPRLCGGDAYINGFPISILGGISNGFINPSAQYGATTANQAAWLNTINERGSEALSGTRGMIGFSRGVTPSSVQTVHPIFNSPNITGLIPGMKIVPLYLTTQADIVSKCQTIGIPSPDLSKWIFQLLNPMGQDQEIDSLSINEGIPTVVTSLLIDNYSTIMTRGSAVQYLSNVMPDITSWQTYTPNLSDIGPQDFILGIRVYDKVVGIYWATYNNAAVPTTPYFPIGENDDLSITMTAPPSRGFGPTSSSFYLNRGGGNLSYNNLRTSINTDSINNSQLVGLPNLTNYFADMMNIAPIQILRGGTPFVHMTRAN